MTYKATILADSPISYWRLGELHSFTAADVQGANPGEYKGDPARGAEGVLGGGNPAVSFDGEEQFVLVPDSSSLDLGSAMTYEAWVKRASFGDGGQRTIVDKGSGSFLVRVDGDDHLLLRVNSVANLAESTTAIADEDWHHVVATVDGSTCKIYLDGADVTSPVGEGSAVANELPLVIGAVDGGTSGYFDGILDEVAVYGMALSAAQVEAHYEAGVAEEAEEAPEPEPKEGPWLGDEIPRVLELQEKEEGRITEVDTPGSPITLHGTTIRFECRDGDSLSKEEEEAEPPTTRAEVFTMGPEFAVAHDVVRWYRWLTRFDPSYDTENATGFRTITQFKRTSNEGACFSLHTLADEIKLDDVFSGAVAGKVHTHRWYDFELEAVWSEDEKAAYQRLYLNRKLVGEVNNVLQPGGGIYLKWGYYKAAEVPGGVLYHGGMCCAETREELGKRPVRIFPEGELATGSRHVLTADGWERA